MKKSLKLRLNLTKFLINKFDLIIFKDKLFSKLIDNCKSLEEIEKIKNIMR